MYAAETVCDCAEFDSLALLLRGRLRRLPATLPRCSSSTYLLGIDIAALRWLLLPASSLLSSWLAGDSGELLGDTAEVAVATAPVAAPAAVAD